MAKEIPLTKGKVAIVDDDVYEEHSQYKWHCSVNGYAARRSKNKIVYLHREILNAPKGKIVDHKNQDRLDNRRSNLRICTQGENLRNRGNQTNNTSGYKGVSYMKREDKWRAYLKYEGQMYWLGSYKDKKDAAKAYNEKAVEFFGEFACLNKI